MPLRNQPQDDSLSSLRPVCSRRSLAVEPAFETRLARRSPNLLLAVLVPRGEPEQKHGQESEGSWSPPATVEPRNGIAGMDGDIVRRIVTRLAVDEQLPIGRIILGRTQLNTVVLRLRMKEPAATRQCRFASSATFVRSSARAGRHHILRVIDPSLSLALGIATNDGHICGNWSLTTGDALPAV